MNRRYRNLVVAALLMFAQMGETSSADPKMEKLETLVGAPRIEITDSPLVSARCVAVAQLFMGLAMQKLGLTDPSMLPQKHLDAMGTFMPFAGHHLGITGSFSESPRIRDSFRNYLAQADPLLVEIDYQFCLMWGYWNIQKYGAP